MEWQPLESKMFLSAAYDAKGQILYLRFRSGDVYRYFDFPADHYRDFLSAESHGRFFLSHIKDHFRFERLAKLRTA
jgi:KTSC domain